MLRISSLIVKPGRALGSYSGPDAIGEVDVPGLPASDAVGESEVTQLRYRRRLGNWNPPQSAGVGPMLTFNPECLG